MALSALLTITGAPIVMPAARAEENVQLLRISLVTQPDSLVEPGDVTLILGIENTSDTDAENVYLSSSDGLFSEPIGQIEAGQTISLNRPHSVSQAELDSGAISYIISHDDPYEEGHKVNYTVQAPIRRSELQPGVEFTRQFSSRYVSPGDTVTISYNILNTGNVALDSLRIQDSLGDFTGRIERLDVGESRTLISRVTLHEAGVSSATLTYDVNALDEDSFIRALADAPVRIAYGQIDAQLSAGFSAFSNDTAEVVLLLSNLGNVDYPNLRISDDIYGGVVADHISLPSGSADPITISATYPVRGNGGFRWRITGVSESGEQVDLVTDTVYLNRPEPAYPAELTLQSFAITPEIRKAGNVPVLIYLENPGDADASNIQLSEASLGTIHNFAVLPAGGYITRQLSLPVEEEHTEFSFSIRYTDYYGETRGAVAAPVSVDITPDGILPEGAEEAFFEFSGGSFKIGGSSTFAVLLAAGVVILITLIIILLVLSRRARLEKKLRMAAGRQRRRAEPVRSTPPQKKTRKPDSKGSK